MPLFARSPKPPFIPNREEARAPRLLFLDDDPGRAEVFLAENPLAVWVQTVADCIARLEEPWDEVHLDHDLGGEHFVDLGREDCGMEVVRWLCLQSRPHLRTTRFHIHSHNPTAATVMGMQMMFNGYSVVVRPFGAAEPLRITGDEPPRPSPLAALGRLFRRLIGRYDDGLPRSPGDDQPPMEHFDFNWTIPKGEESLGADRGRDHPAEPAPEPPRSS